MKSTLKIDYAPNGKPIIKIIQPQEVVDLHSFAEGDYDVRDKLISDFVHSPLSVNPNGLFEVWTQGSLEKEPNFHVTTITPIAIKDYFYKFKHTILGLIIPYEDLIKINRGEAVTLQEEKSVNFNIDLSVDKYRKINEFFNWLDSISWASWEEQQPN